MAAQREILAQVFANGNSRAAIQFGEDALMCFHADQRLVAALANAHAPVRRGDETRIGGVFQHQLHLAFIGEALALARLLPRPFREAFKKALHFGQRVEAQARKTFERFLRDGGKRLIAHQKRAFVLCAFIAVAHGRFGDEVALFNAGSHFLNRLTAKLMTFQFAACGNNRFEEAPFGCLIKAEVQAVGNGVILFKRAAKPPMELRIAREAFQIVKDYDVAFAAI
nr:hypothetical protein [Hyphomonas sp.]